MANLQDIKRRIASVKNTQQITKAMKLVAAAKLRKAQEAVESSRPYSTKMYELMTSIAARSNPDSHPLLRRGKVENILIILFTADKGLCGPFNSSMIRTAQRLIADNEGKGISMFTIGRKGFDYFRRRRVTIADSLLDYEKSVGYALAEQLAEPVFESFISEKVDIVYLLYNKFKNVVVSEAQTISLLPIKLEYTEEELGTLVDYEYEPSAGEILDGILRRYVISQIHQAMLESGASEHGARMTAMDAATKNSREMIDQLTLDYNRARQAAITTELIEVVTGADALEG